MLRRTLLVLVLVTLVRTLVFHALHKFQIAQLMMMVVSCCRLSESMHTFVMLESPSSTLTKARILMGSHSLTVIRICHAICVSKVGYPTTRHIGPEAGTWELDHLIHSSPHTGVSIFVKFYSPKERQSKVWSALCTLMTCDSMMTPGPLAIHRD